jgi:hypothetical protein
MLSVNIPELIMSFIYLVEQTIKCSELEGKCEKFCSTYKTQIGNLPTTPLNYLIKTLGKKRNAIIKISCGTPSCDKVTDCCVSGSNMTYMKRIEKSISGYSDNYGNIVYQLNEIEKKEKPAGPE